MTISTELRRALLEWRTRSVEVGGKRVPATIPLLRGALAVAEDSYAQDEILSALSDEYFRAECHDEVLEMERERVSRNPETVVVWLSLADALSDRPDGADEARSAAARGVSNARRSDALVRHALIRQALIAKKLDDKNLFEGSLIELIDDARNERSEDCYLNPNIVDGLSEGFCSLELIAKYRVHCGA